MAAYLEQQNECRTVRGTEAKANESFALATLRREVERQHLQSESVEASLTRL